MINMSFSYSTVVGPQRLGRKGITILVPGIVHPEMNIISIKGVNRKYFDIVINWVGPNIY